MTIMIIGCLTLALIGLWLHTKESRDTPPGGGAGRTGAHLPISGLPTLPLAARLALNLGKRGRKHQGAARALRQELGKKVGKRRETSVPSSDVSSDVTQRRREITSHYDYRRLSAKRERGERVWTHLSRSILPFLIQGNLFFFSPVVFERHNKKQRTRRSLCLRARSAVAA